MRQHKHRVITVALIVCALVLGVIGHADAIGAPPVPKPIPTTPLVNVPYPVETGGIMVFDPYDSNGVTADGFSNPEWKITHGWVSVTIYFNRAETRSMKTASTAGAILSGVCAAAKISILICPFLGAVVAQWTYVAGNAYADGNCMKLKWYPGLGTWAYAYSGGYCTPNWWVVLV